METAADTAAAAVVSDDLGRDAGSADSAEDTRDVGGGGEDADDEGGGGEGDDASSQEAVEVRRYPTTHFILLFYFFPVFSPRCPAPDLRKRPPS